MLLYIRNSQDEFVSAIPCK